MRILRLRFFDTRCRTARHADGEAIAAALPIAGSAMMTGRGSFISRSRWRCRGRKTRRAVVTPGEIALARRRAAVASAVRRSRKATKRGSPACTYLGEGARRHEDAGKIALGRKLG